MNISDLNQSISEMTEEELHAKIRDIRTERRKNDKPIKKVKAKAKTPKQPKKVKNMRTMLATMTAEEKAELLASLES